MKMKKKKKMFHFRTKGGTSSWFVERFLRVMTQKTEIK